MTEGSPRPSDPELWASVEATIRDVILPDLTDDWSRAAAVQLIGLAVYAQQRGNDRGDANSAELVAALDELAASGNEIVSAVWPDPGCPAAEAVSLCLAAAVLRDDAAADALRRRLRPVVLSQLDEDLAESAPLLEYFRGRLPDA
jgi:hypothetical protein